MKFATWLLVIAAVVLCNEQYIRRSELASPCNLLIGQEFFRSKDPAVFALTAAISNQYKGLIGGARWAPPSLINTVPFVYGMVQLGIG
jgi:hypothetical protein